LHEAAIVVRCQQPLDALAQAELLADRWFFAGSDKPEVREMDSPPGRPSDSAHSSPAP